MAFDQHHDTFSFDTFNFSQPLQPSINDVTSPSIQNDAFWSHYSTSHSQSNSSINELFPSISMNSTSGSGLNPADSGPIKAHKVNGGLPLSLFGGIEGNGSEINGFYPSNLMNSASGSGSVRADSGPITAQKGNGAVPLSLFGEFDENPCFGNGNLVEDCKKGDGLIDFGSGFDVNFNGVPSNLIVDNNNNSSNNNINNNNSKNESENDNNDEEDEWEFKVAFFGNGDVDQGSLKGGAVANGSNLEPLAMKNQEKQAGQDASKSVNINHDSFSFFPQSTDFFVAPYGNGANHQTNEMDVGFKSSTNTTNGFLWDPFPAAENMGNGNVVSASSINEDEDFDDFGDFVDASQEVVSKDQEPDVAHMNLAEPQLPNGELQEMQTQTGHTRGALPLSFFGDDTEESSDSLNIENEAIHMPTLSSGNSFNGQGSAISIQDLISNLYSQSESTSTNSVGKPVENGVHLPSNTGPPTLDEDWDDDSWEFKGALSQNVVGGQLFTSSPEIISQKESEILPELQSYTEFYDQLRDTLCSLLSCQLDELKKAQSSDAITGNGETAEPLDDEIQEAFKLLEESMISKEVLSHELDRYHCLNKFVEILQGPKLNMIESDFSLLERLQLATKEWRVSAELLRHAISMQKVLSLGSADEQSLYASTWSKILNVCIHELRCGSLIWRRALETNVKHQILSDVRGQQHIQALGEIYKVVALLRLSAKVYKPWILRSVSESSQIFAVLDECDALWSNSGLAEAIQNLSDDITFGCSETAKSTIAFIKSIHDINIFTVHDRVFTQHKSLCRLSLLPLEVMADMKTVKWGEESYFLNVANLWANMINCNPPQLPHLEVS